MYIFLLRHVTETMIMYLFHMNIHHTIVTDKHISISFLSDSITDLLASKGRMDPLQVHQAFPCRGGSYRCFRLSRVGPLVPFPFLITCTELVTPTGASGFPCKAFSLISYNCHNIIHMLDNISSDSYPYT